MSNAAAWEDKLLSLLDRPGWWITLGVHSTQAGAADIKRRAIHKAVVAELDMSNVQHRIVRNDDGSWLFQARWVVSTHTPRYVNVDTTEGNHHQVMTAGSLLVTPGVVQGSKRWHGDPNVIVFHASSTVHHNVMRWVLPRDVAGYARLALNLQLGGDIKLGASNLNQ